MNNRTLSERWWWLGAFVLLSILIHLFLAHFGPGMGIKGEAPSAGQIELTLEPLPPDKKPAAPKPKAKVAARPHPKALPKVVKDVKAPKPVKVAEKKPVTPKITPKPQPKVAVKPIEDKPVVRPVVQPTPQIHVAQAAPTPAVTHAVVPAHVVTPEAPTEPTQPVKVASVTPHFSPTHSLLPMANPLAGLEATDDKPQATAARSDTPRITRSASARSGLSGGASGGGHGAARGPQTPVETPTPDAGLSGGMHFPQMASRIGGQSIMSVNNPLAEDAVPEEKPGFSSGTGGHPGIGAGGGRGGLNGLRVASRLSGRGSGFGGGIGGGRGAGSGKGSGSGRGSGRGTGAGSSGSGDGNGADVPGGGADGYGGAGFGTGSGAGGSGHGKGDGGFRVAASISVGGGAFGGVGDLLRGEPVRAPGDGQPGHDGHGLSAEIYEERPYLTKLVHHRTDATIDFNWGQTIPVMNGVSRIFSMRWTGQIQPRYSETYTFATQEDDGMNLWVDGRQLVSDWQDHDLTARHGTIRLQAGRKYDIRVEYFNGPRHARGSLGHAEVHLRWSSPSQPQEIVPESALWQAKS